VVYPGDFVKVNISAPQRLYPYLVADGAYGGDTIWSAIVSANSDGLTHFRTFRIVNTSIILM
jgi:hypothetical protein